MDKGFLTIGLGESFPIAVVSAIAFQQHHSGIPTAIITDHDIQIEGIQTIRASDREPAEIKTLLEQFSPWQQTVYLDAHCLVLQPIPKLFEMGLGLCPAELPSVEHYETKDREWDYTTKHHAKQTLWRTDLIAWRSGETNDELFKAWHAEYQRFYRGDRLALSRAFDRCGVPATELPWRYCLPVGHYTNQAITEGKTKVLHLSSPLLNVNTWFNVAQNLVPDAIGDPRAVAALKNYQKPAIA
jgi:hypothetical protein